jgi:hypothetical protein
LQPAKKYQLLLTRRVGYLDPEGLPSSAVYAEPADRGRDPRSRHPDHTSGFGAMLGGSRIFDRYERLEAHGIYWTASDNGNGSPSAPFYNFGKGGQALNRHVQGDKQMAASVRCIRN